MGAGQDVSEIYEQRCKLGGRKRGVIGVTGGRGITVGGGGGGGAKLDVE